MNEAITKHINEIESTLEVKVKELVELIVSDAKETAAKQLLEGSSNTSSKPVSTPKIVQSKPSPSNGGAKRGRKPTHEPKILELVDEKGSVPIDDVVEKLGVAETYAPQLAAKLADEGKIKFEGGVLTPATAA